MRSSMSQAYMLRTTAASGSWMANRLSSVSKAALIRRYVGERLRPLPPLEEDPLWDIVGMVQGGPDDSMRVNEIVYDHLGHP